MSHALILAAVTAVLKNLLENGLASEGITAQIGSEAAITTLPPDRVNVGADEKAQINLFLYQIVPKGLFSAIRNTPDSEADRRASGPLSLELSYLLTAYGAHDLDIEILLGYAMELLSRKPVLTTDVIQAILASLSSAEGGRLVLPAIAALAAPGLADQITQIKTCPQMPEPEEISKLWSMMQARFRPSVVYKVSVVLNNENC